DRPFVELERRIIGLHARRFMNPYAGRQLYRMFREHGLGKITFDLFNIPLEPESVETLLGVAVQQALLQGAIVQWEWLAFRRALSLRAAYGTFFAHLSMVAVAGQRH